jgi:presenilin-like A22 family membrane protease
VRLFPKATDSNFILAFVFLPAVFVAYYWHYPRNKSRILQIAYTLAVTGFSTLVHVAVQKYTDLLVYITLSGYKLWPMGVIAYYVMRIYADWYLCQLAKARSGNP